MLSLLTQQKFAKDLIEEFGDEGSSPVIRPLEHNCKFSAYAGDLFDDPGLYRKTVGKLNFLTNTRTDLAFTVWHLSQFMQQPQVPHFEAVRHVLRYLQGQPDLGIMLHDTSDLTSKTYCDSDWASKKHTRRSVSGYVIFFGGSLISWKSKKQGTVSLSSAEAEYRSFRRLVALWQSQHG